MKLRTEMVDGRVYAPSECEGFEDMLKVRHDAMAAHALLQAMGEIEGTYADCSTAEDVRTFLHERADEILAGWMGEAG